MKKAHFGSVEGDKGESDVRANIETVKDEPVEKVEDEHTEKLAEIAAFFQGKKDDVIMKDYGVHPVHMGLIRELADKKKGLVMNDGNKECVSILHKKLARHLAK